MKEREPARWISDPLTDPAFRKLLQAGRNDRPSPQSVRAAPAAVAALLTVKMATATAPALGLAAMGSRGALTSTLILKWFAGGVLTSVAVLSVAHAPPSSERPPASVSLPHAPAAPRVASSAEARAVSLATSTAPLQAPTAIARAGASRPDVAREVAFLDEARRALLAGDPKVALSRLAALERLPERALVPEATVLQVRALLAANDVSAARALARRFVAAAPNSPQARVLRGLFGSGLDGEGTDFETPLKSGDPK